MPVGDASVLYVTFRRDLILKGGWRTADPASIPANVGVTTHAAAQQTRGTIAALRRPIVRPQPLLPPAGHVAAPLPMTSQKPRQYTIRGVTTEGRTFRPSDWSERLAGAMSSFRPGGGAGTGSGGIGAYIGYSPYCVPQVVDGVKCVLVNEALRGIEPMAWDFVMNFARDNQLTVVELTAP